VYQLAIHNDQTRARAKERYSQVGEDSRLADYDQLILLFESLLEVFTEVYIIIDALDECIEQDETCAFIEELCNRRLPGVRILASSNTTQSRETEATLTRLKTDKLYVSVGSVNHDIESHIRKLDLGQWEDDQKGKIISHITAKSDGS
jgi:hypothetical protein